MSSPIRPVTMDEIRFMVEHHLPDATWTFGGALRFDRSLNIIINNLRSSFPLRQPRRVAGCPACKWSLDWYTERRPMGLQKYAEELESYAARDIGVVLTFDNPFITEEALNDSYGLSLLSELYKRDRVHLNAVCVASDLLATHIRSMYPRLPLYCHPNRLICERSKRTADLYNKLSESYDRVCLHPADASRPAIYSGIHHPEKYDIVINDPLPRASALRREHLMLLAEIRRDPYNADLNRRRADMVARDGWHTISRDTLRQKQSCNLTHEESTALYTTGFRSFVIQGNQFRNEMTLLWDIFQCILDYSPELNNKSALIASAIMAAFSGSKTELTSGLRQFSFTNYE